MTKKDQVADKMKDTKTVEGLIRHVGEILIELRKDRTKEFAPEVLKHILLEIAADAKAEGRREERERISKGIDEQHPRYATLGDSKEIFISVVDLKQIINKPE